MVPCTRGLGSSVFDFNRARPCHYVECIRSWLTFLCQSQRPPNLKEKHRTVFQITNSPSPVRAGIYEVQAFLYLCRHEQWKLKIY